MTNDNMTPDTLAHSVSQALQTQEQELLERLGIWIEDVTPGHASCCMTVQDNMVNAGTVCHGGFIFSLADTALAYASLSLNRVSLTLSASISFLGPAKAGDTLTAYADLVHTSNRTCTCTVNVVNQQQQPVAQLLGTGFRRDQTIV